jgi:hypothetical protein
MRIVTPRAIWAAVLALPLSSGGQAQTASLQSLLPADSALKLSGSVRIRYEEAEGQARAGFNPTDRQLALRSILSAEYATGPWRLGLEVQDSRAWLGRVGSGISANDVDALEPMQAYVGLVLPGALGQGTRASIQAGRFTWNFGSRRFIASDEYRNVTSSYTGVRAELKGRDGEMANLFYLLPQVRLPDDLASVLANRIQLDRESFDLQLFGGTVSRPRTLAGGLVEMGWYRLAERDSPGRPTRDRRLHTFTVRLLREPKTGQADFDVEAAWQVGTVSTSTVAGAPGQGVAAGMVHASAGYTLRGPARLRVSGSLDWVEGDGPGGRYNRFDTLFGGRRFEWAPSGVFNAIGRANILAPAVRLEAAPGKRFDAMVLYRPMWLASRTDAFSTTAVVDKAGNSGRFAGHHVDARVRQWLVPGLLRAELDYEFVAKGRFLTSAPNAPRTGNTNYGAAALTASF